MAERGTHRHGVAHYSAMAGHVQPWRRALLCYGGARTDMASRTILLWRGTHNHGVAHYSAIAGHVQTWRRSDQTRVGSPRAACTFRHAVQGVRSSTPDYQDRVLVLHRNALILLSRCVCVVVVWRVGGGGQDTATLKMNSHTRQTTATAQVKRRLHRGSAFAREETRHGMCQSMVSKAY